MSSHDKILIEELEKRLLWYREEASEEEFDADEVDAICTMLQKLSPPAEPHRTKEEAFQNIMRQISLEGENPKGEEAEKADRKKVDGENAAADGSVEESAGDESGKKRRFLAGKLGIRAAVIFLVAAGALASLNMVSYARENKSLFTMILERVGWLEIVKDETVESTNVGSAINMEKFYNSWAELDLEIKEKIRVPSYIPEGYSLYGIKCWDFNNRENIQVDYYNQENGHLHIGITVWEDDADQLRENVADESVYVLIPEYSDDKTLYYAYEDEYICMAFMEYSFYRINGNITLEEMVKIGEGLQERLK